MEKIAIVIPCYNEAKGIANVIKSFPYVKLARYGFAVQVYVIDNNSTDNTAKVAAEAGAIVLHESQKGKGNAVRAGFQSLPKDIDYVAMLDGDDTYSAHELLRMVEPLHNGFCDAVIGSRLGGQIEGDSMTAFNRSGNWIFTHLVRYAYRTPVTDVLTGYFAWKKDVIDDLYPHLVSDGFAIEMEMITKMARMGTRITSVPISYAQRAGDSNLSPVKDGFRILRMFLNNLAWKPDVPTNVMMRRDQNVKLPSRAATFGEQLEIGIALGKSEQPKQ
jgi:glycosyltransferase involved in cell wall biosynthesis